MIKLQQVGQIEGMREQVGRVYGVDELCPTLTTMEGGHLQPKIMEENKRINIAAVRGRNKNSDKTEQVLEKGSEFTSNAITTVQKNNYLCENIDIQCLNSKVDGKQPSLGDRIYSDEGCSSAIATAPFFTGSIQHIRIRKLTPRECWRLMGFKDEDFDRARYGKDVRSDYLRKMEKRTLQKTEWRELWRTMRHPNVSNSQLYKQAGNSIVVDVLMAIFGRML